MPGTRTQSSRTPTVIENVGQYEIHIVCTDPGSLPDSGIFLLSIVDVTGPKSDILVRIIELGDTTAYSNDREAAIADGDTQWRSSELRLVYGDIETANEAQKELSQRINTLVVNFDTVNSEFTVTNEITVYPVTVNTTTQAVAKDNYAKATAAVVVAEEARNAHTADCAALEVELANIQVRLNDANSDFTAVATIRSSLTILQGAYLGHHASVGSYTDTIKLFNNASDALPDQKDDISGEITNIELEMQVMVASNASLATTTTDTITLYAILQARIITLNADKAAKNTTFYQCSVALTKAQADVVAAREAQDAALVAARAVCPDFAP